MSWDRFKSRWSEMPLVSTKAQVLDLIWKYVLTPLVLLFGWLWGYPAMSSGNYSSAGALIFYFLVFLVLLLWGLSLWFSFRGKKKQDGSESDAAPPKQLSMNSLGWPVHAGIFIVGLLAVVLFFVWGEEKKPLEGTVQRVEFLDDSAGGLVALAFVQIRNTSSNLMGVKNFRIIYDSTSGDRLRLEPFVVAGTQKKEYPGGRVMTMIPDDTLFPKLGKPIDPNGGFISGLVPFLLPGKERGRLKGAKITYCFDDMDNNAYCMSQTLSKFEYGVEEGVGVIPGERVQ